MVATKTEDETLASPLNGKESVYCVQGGAARRFTPDQLRSAILHPGYATRHYLPLGLVPGTGAVHLAAGQPSFTPWPVPQKITIDTMSVLVTTAAASGNFQLAIYSVDVATGNLTLVASTPSGSTASTGVVTVTFASPVTLNPGFYVVGLMMDNTTAVVVGSSSVSGMTHSEIFGASAIPLGASASTNVNSFRSPAGTFGTWPSTIAYSGVTEQSSTRAPFFSFHVSAVPPS